VHRIKDEVTAGEKILTLSLVLKAGPLFSVNSIQLIKKTVAALALDPNKSHWNGKSLSSGQLARIYGFNDLDGSQPDCWRYIVEIEDAGKPADVSGYR
jgi:hypothetical protein